MVSSSLGEEPLFDALLGGLLALSLAVMGARVATRQPGNLLGCLFCGLGESLRSDLTATVHSALQPASVGVWLRPGVSR